jgi:hypothetical protein
MKKRAKGGVLPKLPSSLQMSTIALPQPPLVLHLLLLFSLALSPKAMTALSRVSSMMNIPLYLHPSLPLHPHYLPNPLLTSLTPPLSILPLLAN